VGHRLPWTTAVKVTACNADQAYVIAFIDVEDLTSYAPYAAGVPATIAAHGGRCLVRNGNKEVREGSLPAE